MVFMAGTQEVLKVHKYSITNRLDYTWSSRGSKIALYACMKVPALYIVRIHEVMYYCSPGVVE